MTLGKTIITGQAEEFHVRVFLQALEAQNSDVYFWDTSKAGSDYTASLFRAQDQTEFCINDLGNVVRAEDIHSSCFWRLPPADFTDRIVAEDLDAVDRSHRIFTRGLVWQICSSSNAMIRYPNCMYAENKANQLFAAINAGLNVPKTLISTDIGDVVAEFGVAEQIVCKPLTPHGWDDEKTLPAVKVSAGSISSESAAISPFIYQRYVEKVADLRVVAWGGHVEASKMTPKSQDQYFDSRLWNRENSEILPIKVPESIRVSIIKLLDYLGLAFGVLDFAIDADGNWHFFELNPAGNFLFCENRCEELHWLDNTVQFLRFGSEIDNFKPVKSDFGHRLADYLN